MKNTNISTEYIFIYISQNRSMSNVFTSLVQRSTLRGANYILIFEDEGMKEKLILVRLDSGNENVF